MSEEETLPQIHNLAGAPFLVTRGDGVKEPRVITDQGIVRGAISDSAWLVSFHIRTNEKGDMINYNRVLNQDQLTGLTFFQGPEHIHAFAEFLNKQYLDFKAHQQLGVKDVTAAGSEGAVGTVTGVNSAEANEDIGVKSAAPAEKETPMSVGLAGKNVSSLAAARAAKAAKAALPCLPEDDGVDPPPMPA